MILNPVHATKGTAALVPAHGVTSHHAGDSMEDAEVASGPSSGPCPCPWAA